jgi:3'(2'), 5'-bisphosphate nucleotidase
VDGTSYFVKGEDDYAVMIGLAIDREPVLGVLFQPATGILWRALDTRAAGLNFLPMAFCERLETSSSKPFLCDIKHHKIMNNEPTAAASRRNPSEFIEFLAVELSVSHVIRRGSFGLKLALIADGRADFYLTSTKRMKLWDTCAPSVILSAAGGVTKSLDGQKLRFFGSIEHGHEIYSATPSGEEWLKERLPKAIKKWQHHLTSV